VGVLTFTVAPSSVSDALAATDEMMYEAKRRGKNRVVNSLSAYALSSAH
jgi:PleD family two-component response regulator